MEKFDFSLFSRLKKIDLTHPLDESVPTWTGGCGFRLEIKMDYPEGLRVQSLKSHAGVGTHMDAPSHFIEGGKNIGEVVLDDLIVPFCVLDISQKRDPDLFIQKEDIEAFERKEGKIPKKALFAAYTGWDKFWKEPEKYRNRDREGRMHFPGFSQEAAEYLLEKGVSGIGIDTLSPDGSNNGKGAKTYPVHLAILGAGKYILENLANLSQMPSQAYAICLPAKAMEASEAACRIIGLF